MKLEHTGKCDLTEPIDLQTTIESGQTFLWNKEDDSMFDYTTENSVYSTARTVNDNEIMLLKIQSIDDYTIKWDCTHEQGEQYIKSIFQLDKDITSIQRELIDKDNTGTLEKSINQFPGLRIIKEPLFSTLISFICSTQMRVERIHEMVQSLSQEYGKEITVNNNTYYSFPTPEELSNVTKDELLDLKLGYRASYVVKTMGMIKNDDYSISLSEDVDKARNQLKKYVGVGPKVADCVLLYGAGFHSVVPVDIWIERAAEEYYPNLTGGSRNDIARNLENMFGDYAGFAQAYLFHYMRMNNNL